MIPKISQACLTEGFDGFLFTFKSMLAVDTINTQIKAVKEEKMTRDDYIDLYSPALEWLLHNIGSKSSEDLFFALLQQYKDDCNCSAVLVHILGSFDPAFVSQHALDMTRIIKASDEITAVPKSKLYLALRCVLIQHAPPAAQRLPILNHVWKAVTKIESPLASIEIACVFVQYLLFQWTEREVQHLPRRRDQTPHDTGPSIQGSCRQTSHWWWPKACSTARWHEPMHANESEPTGPRS